MTRRCIIEPGRIALVCGVMAGLAACVQHPQTVGTVDAAKPSAASSCAPAQEDFTNALGYYAPNNGPAETDPATPPAVALRADAEAADEALERLVGTYGTLVACHSGTPLAADTRAARDAFASAAAIEAQLRQRLQHLSAGRVPVAETATATSVLVETPYLATDDGAICARPAGREIAALRKGQRVTAPPVAEPAQGWVAIDLDDGSTGYVQDDLLRRLVTTRHRHVMEAVADVDIATQIISQALPQKRADLQARLGSDAATSAGGT